MNIKELFAAPEKIDADLSISGDGGRALAVLPFGEPNPPPIAVRAWNLGDATILVSCIHQLHSVPPFSPSRERNLYIPR
jgi:hypothetical protein